MGSANGFWNEFSDDLLGSSGPSEFQPYWLTGLRIDPKREKGTASPFHLDELRKLSDSARNCLEAETNTVGQASTFSRFFCETVYQSFAFCKLRLV